MKKCGRKANRGETAAQFGLSLAGKGEAQETAGVQRALQRRGQCRLSKEMCPGSREDGHVGSSEKDSQVVAPERSWTKTCE